MHSTLGTLSSGLCQLRHPIRLCAGVHGVQGGRIGPTGSATRICLLKGLLWWLHNHIEHAIVKVSQRTLYHSCFPMLLANDFSPTLRTVWDQRARPKQVRA